MSGSATLTHARGRCACSFGFGWFATATRNSFFITAMQLTTTTTCLLIVPLDPSIHSVSGQLQLIATQKDYRAFSIFSPLCCLLLFLSQKIQKRIHSSSSLCYILERFYSTVTEVPVTHLICTLSKQSSLLHHGISSDTFHARRLCSGSRPIDSVVL